MDAVAKGSPARGALALLVALGAVAAGTLLQPDPRAIDLDATVERVAAELRAVDALLAPEALAARVTRLRALVEAELGAPIPGDVEVVPIDPQVWIERQVARDGHALDAAGEAAVKAWMRATTAATLQALFTLARYDPESGRIELLSHHLVDEHDDDARAALLDLVLSHELVHAWHHRLHPDAPLLAGTDDPERAAATAAAAEGHAQAVARRVARRLGLLDRFERIVPRLDSPELAQLPPVDRVQAEHVMAPLAFRYRVGERYVDALIRRYGLAEATRHVLEQPPRTVWEVCRPDEQPAPRTAAGASLEPLADRVALALGPAGPQLEPVVPGELWLNLRDGPDPDGAVAHVRRAVRFDAGGFAVRLVLLDGAQAAENFAEAWERSGGPAEQGLEVLGTDARGERGTRLVVSTVRDKGGFPGFVLRGLIARGPVFVELAATRPTSEEAGFLRAVDRVAAMAGDARLRAVAESAPVVADLADDDPGVAVVTLHALMRAGRLDEVPPDLRVRGPVLAEALEAWPEDRDVARAALDSASAEVRRAAVLHVGGLAPRPHWAAAALDDALGDPDPAVRAAALEKPGDRDAARVRALLADGEPRVRALALANLASRSLLAPGELGSATHDPSAGVRAAAWALRLREARSLERDDDLPEPAELEAAMDDPSAIVRMRIAEALPGLVLRDLPQRVTGAGEPRATRALLVRALRDADPRVRAWALAGLQMGSVAGSPRAAVAALWALRDLRDVQLAAPSVLANWVGRDPRATDMLTGLLTEGWPQREAAAALAPDTFERAEEDGLAQLCGRATRLPVPALLPVFRALAESRNPSLRLRGLAGQCELGERPPEDTLRHAVAEVLRLGCSLDRQAAAHFAVPLGEPGARILLDHVRAETDPLCLGNMLYVLDRMDDLPVGEVAALAVELLDTRGDLARARIIDWAETLVRDESDSDDAWRAAVGTLAQRILPMLSDPESWVRSAAACFAEVLPAPWRDQADRLLAGRIRVEADRDVFERLADWRNFYARTDEHMPPVLREALETRREDPDPKIAGHAADALDAD